MTATTSSGSPGPSSAKSVVELIDRVLIVYHALRHASLGEARTNSVDTDPVLTMVHHHRSGQIGNSPLCGFLGCRLPVSTRARDELI